VALGAFGLVLNGYGNSRYQEGRLEAINAQTNTDLAHLTEWASQQQGINEQVLKGLDGLNAYQNTPLDPGIAASLKWVRNTAKPKRNTN